VAGLPPARSLRTSGRDTLDPGGSSFVSGRIGHVHELLLLSGARGVRPLLR
jgi:hypothetical protein